MTRHFALVMALTLLAGAVYPAKSVPAQEQRPNDGHGSPDVEHLKAKVLLEELEELLDEEGMANNNGGSDVDEMAQLPEKRDPEPTDADCLLKTTDTTYEYRWDLPQLTGTRFTFQVSTNSDAHIGLSPANQDATDMYEIVLGGWGNTKSAIRRGKLGSDVTNVDTPAINSPTEYRTFWINLASDGTISVGKGGESLPFMSWTDPRPIRVSYAGYSTGWGSDGRWKFCSETDCSMTMLKTTDTTYEYRWDLPQLTGTRFTFQVSTNSDAHIGLSPANQDATDMYEIVLGGWGNTKSAIRRGKLGSDVTNVDTPAINSPTEYRTFWINLASDGTISVGKGGESLPFMSWTDPNPIRVSYAGYSTGWGSEGRWKFCSETATTQASTTVGTTEVVTSTPTVQCDNPAVLNGNSGSFTSPGYPGHYPNSAYCTWQISVSTSDVVAIRFTEFSLEYNRNCGFDSLVVHDGPDDTAPVLVTLCGSSARTVVTTGNSAFLVFSSDVSVTRSGFVADFTSELHCSMTMLKTTDTTYEYRWDLPQLTGTRFTFQVSANSDAHIGLSPANQDATDMYEIVLGGWGNTKSAIRRGKLGSDVTNVDTPAINSPTEYRTFWINLASDGTISVGKGGESLPFMSWTDPNPIRVSYAGYSTGWGSDGRWKFCSETGTSTKRMSEVRETDGKDNGEHKVEVVKNGKQQPIKGQDGMWTGQDPEETLETVRELLDETIEDWMEDYQE
ncbi:uncharacterized protein LOC144921857 isoform X1 [Branchiostoma floridae x Branchiostoma belcheri]